jgi:hypothetical protein
MMIKCLPFLLCYFSVVYPGNLEKTKFYCMVTPSFQMLLNEYFLPSIQDDFEVIIREFSEDCPTGTFRSQGWDLIMLHKLEMLKEAIKENWNNGVFFYSDIDVIFFKPIMMRCLSLLGDLDFLVQQRWPKNFICAGFFVMKGNEKTLRLICEAERLLSQKLKVDDQLAIQEALQIMEGEIDWEFLPIDEFPNGRRVLVQPTGHYSLFSEIILPSPISLFHASCCIGLDLKMDFLRRVQFEYFKLEGK